MRAALVLAIAAASSGACGKTLTIYHRTSPRRVEVTKQASPPVLFARAVRRPTGELALRVKHASRMSLTRVLHHNAIAMVYDHSGSVWNEAVELIVGLLMAPLPGAFWGMGDRIDGQDTATRKTVRHRRLLLALLDPTTSVFTNNIRTEPIVEEQVFSDPPVVRAYEIRLPVPGAAVSYRILDAAGGELARGTGATDVHGEVLAPGAFDDAVAVELTTGGKVLTVPVEPPDAARIAAGGDTPASRRAPTRHVAGALVNEGWSKVRKQRREIPRVTLTTDLVYPLFFAGPQVRAELRVHPRISISVLAARHDQTYLTTVDDEVTGTATAAGGQLRLYLGDFARGIHLGVEGAYGEVEIELGSGTREVTQYGAFGGYKYVFDFGFTVDLSIGGRYERDADATGDNVLAGGQLFGHLDVGWSF